MERLIQEPDLIEDAPAEIGCLLQDVVGEVDELPEIERLGRGKAAFDVALRVNQIALPVNRTGLRVLLQGLDRGRNRARQQDVVGIQPRQNVSPSHAKALVDGMGLSSVVFGDKRQAAGVFFDD